jgi:glycogen synthase
VDFTVSTVVPTRPRLLGVTNFYPPAITGGYGEICADVMRGLAARGYDVTMLVARGASGAGVEVHADLDPVLAPWRRPLRGLRAVAHDERVVRSALEHGVDAAMVWHMRGLVKPPLRLLHDAGMPVLYMLHDLWVVYERAGGPAALPWSRLDRLGVSALRNVVGGLAAPRLDLRSPPIAEEGTICFVSRWLRDEHARRGWRAHDERIIPAGIDVDAIRAHREHPPRVPPQLLVFAGRIHPTKGLDVAIRALAALGEGVRLTVAGPVDDPAYLARMRALGESLGVDGRINWCGELSREAIFALLASHDVLVYPSKTPETFGLTIAEALAAGSIVVTSALGGPREYLVDGRNALLFNPGDASALADQLSRLARDPELAWRLDNCASRTTDRLSLDSVLDQVEDTLADAMRERRP